MNSNNAGIVRDVVQIEQAKTVTGPYQSPNGPASIIGGFMDAFSKAASRSGGDGGKDYGPLNEMVDGLANEIQSKGLEGSEMEQALTAFRNQATHHSQKYNYSDIENALSSNPATEMYANLAKVPYQEQQAMTTRDITNNFWAGRAFYGSGRTADEYVTKGAELTTSLRASQEVLGAMSGLTPQQTQEYLKEDSMPSQVLEKNIRDKYLTVRRSPEYSNLPAMQTLQVARTASLNELEMAGLDPLTANAIVDRALAPDMVMIAGTDSLKKSGIMELEKLATEQQERFLKTQADNILIDFSNTWFDDPNANPKEPRKIKGSVVLAQIASQVAGGDESKASTFALLAALNGTGYYDQFLKNYSDRHNYETLGWTINNGADFALLASKDPREAKNLGEMMDEALEQTARDIRSKSYSELQDSDTYFQTAKNFVKGHTTSEGKKLSKEAVNALYRTQEEKDKVLKEVLDSTAYGTNAATDDTGFYYIDEDGNVLYLTPYSPAPGKTSLLDSTQEGLMIQMGDADAVRMRDNRGLIRDTLETFIESFGYDPKNLKQLFNETQARLSTGAQKARARQLTGKSFTMDMTDDDVTEVLKMAENYDNQEVEESITKYPAAALAVAKGSVLDFAQRVGELPGDIVLAPGKALAEAVASIAESDNDRAAARELAYQRYRENVADPLIKSALIDKYNIEDPEVIVKTNNQGYVSATYTNENGKVMETLPEDPVKLKEEYRQKVQPTGTVLVKNSDGSYSIKNSDGSTTGKYKTAAEAFRVGSITESVESPAQVAPFEYSGNIDLENRPVVTNEDGSVSTERSIVIEEDGEYIIIPTVINGKIVSDDEAVQYYHETGENHGKYKNVTEAVRKSEEISREQAKRYLKK